MKWLLVSGDNGRKNYDEASGMQQALIAKGVPAKVIFCDYAGFSTLDSVVRANKVFGENHITIISQEFHNQRAIWLAKQYGIDAIGFNAPDLEKGRGKIVRLREKLARVSAVIDAKIFNRQPKYLGRRSLLVRLVSMVVRRRNNAYPRTSKMKKACYIDDRIPLWSIHAL